MVKKNSTETTSTTPSIYHKLCAGKMLLAAALLAVAVVQQVPQQLVSLNYLKNTQVSKVV